MTGTGDRGGEKEEGEMKSESWWSGSVGLDHVGPCRTQDGFGSSSEWARRLPEGNVRKIISI